MTSVDGLSREQLNEIKIDVIGAQGKHQVPLSMFVLKSDGKIDPPIPKPEPSKPADKPDSKSSKGFTVLIVVGVVIIVLALGVFVWQRLRVLQIQGRKTEGGELASNSDYSMLTNNNSRDSHIEDEHTTLRKKHE